MLCFVVCNRSEWGTVFYFQFAIFQYWTAVLKREKKIVGLILFHLRLSTLERLRMFVVLHCIVGGVLSGGLTGGLDVCWSEIKSFGEFVYVPVSVKRFLFVGGPDRLPRSLYLQWKKSGRNLLHFQLKVGVVVWFFFFSFLRAVAFNRLVPLLFYVHVSTTSILCLILVKHQQFLCWWTLQF